MSAGDSGPTGADEARAAIAAVLADADAQVRRAESYVAAVEGLRVRGRDRSGAVVELDHGGGLVDVVVEERVARAGAEPVRRAVLAAVGDARRRLPERLTALAAQAFGPEAATTAHVREHAERQFGAGGRATRSAAGAADGVLR
ncbi:hypothetical protein INN71_01115 [Nocardioides sp. ChNu-153]|uniref:hypothetical protein n=1 Tax=unclassified Nocardioides TaxID=2615069 RepID=UPI00240734B1|nr:MULTISPECIES: hypothetical protein [unclassified Nocardioides]MDF9716017.1 hypothetical protein [Nocardioides sp. ChNu-99]MDN7119985.1 hypothetical protein [Nocardioides sp. ChNu-153]